MEKKEIKNNQENAQTQRLKRVKNLMEEVLKTSTALSPVEMSYLEEMLVDTLEENPDFSNKELWIEGVKAGLEWTISDIEIRFGWISYDNLPKKTKQFLKNQGLSTKPKDKKKKKGQSSLRMNGT